MFGGAKRLRSQMNRILVAAILLLGHAAPVLDAQDVTSRLAPAIPFADASEQSVDHPTQSPEVFAVKNRVDVRTEVWPILQRHCLRCHNHQKSDGDLRLDLIEEIRAGGHTGNIILGSVDDSELLRRISAEDPGYRMPKEGEPLSADEMELLNRWIEQGAPWPPHENASAGGALSSQQLITLSPSVDPRRSSETAEQSWQSWLSQRLDVVSEYQEPMRPLLIAVLLFCLLVLVIERRKRHFRGSDGTALSDWSLRVNDAQYLIASMTFLWVATVLFYRVHQTRLQSSYDKLSHQLDQRESWATASSESAKNGPYRPKHPAWMGGTYYRGNDERNGNLFNGGFYATAKMFLSLRDRNSDALTWNDSIDPKTLAVCLEIQRAPFATPALFNDGSMTTCFLRLAIDQNLTQEPLQKANMQVVEPGERWRACYPLGGLAETSGSVSRYKGGIDLCNAGGQPHYGIRYDIIVEEGRIASESEIWMGATFLTGNVVIPQEGRIPLREWFDFVPIPEITKENSKDPALLGITEHVGTEYFDAAQAAVDPAGPQVDGNEDQ